MATQDFYEVLEACLQEEERQKKDGADYFELDKMRKTTLTKCITLQKPFEVKALAYMSLIREVVSQLNSTGRLDSKLEYYCYALLACQVTIHVGWKTYQMRAVPSSHPAIQQNMSCYVMMNDFFFFILNDPNNPCPTALRETFNECQRLSHSIKKEEVEHHKTLLNFMQAQIIHKIRDIHKKSKIDVPHYNIHTYISRHEWDEKNQKRYMDIPFVESAHLRMKPWNEAHAYWIKKHNSIQANITQEQIKALRLQTAEELQAL